MMNQQDSWAITVFSDLQKQLYRLEIMGGKYLELHFQCFIFLITCEWVQWVQ
jgi:hypothetical protein